MKKITAIILTAAALVTLCACGASSGGQGAGGDVTYENADLFGESGASDEKQLTGRLFRSGDYIFSDNGDGTAYVAAYEGSDTEVVFPSEIDGLSVTGIWSYALQGANPVRKVTLPESVKTLAYCALSKIGLTEIEVDEKNPYLKSVDGVLYTEDGKTLICFPADYCARKGIRKFDLPDSVEVIAAGAFWYDRTLMVVEVGDGNKAFKDIDGVVYSKDGKTVVWFPAGKPYTFYNIPEGVTGIARYAFVCADNIEQFIIPASVEKIAPTAFLGCTALKHLTVNGDNPYYYSEEGKILYNKDKTELIVYPPSTPEARFLFLEGITKIGDYACFKCSFNYEARIPDSVTEIGFNAFKYCSWLREVDLPAGLKVIGENAFADCGDLTLINYAGTVSEWEAIGKGPHWNAGSTPDITVICADGELVVSYE